MVTRNDVARHAGVSVAVVSYVMNNKPFVKDETRKKVLQAMEELGYQPNLTARSLKTRKTCQIAVLTNFIGNPFEAGILLHLEEAANKHGYMITYQSYRPDCGEELKTMFAGRVDGIVLLGQSLSPENLEFFRRRDIPVVSVMKPVRTSEVPLVYVDVDWEAAYLRLLKLLYRDGHRHIAYMTHGDCLHPLHGRWEQFACLLQSEEEFRQMRCSILEGEGKYEGAYKRMMELPEPGFTAVVCANDLMAIGAIAASRARGWSVPGTFSVIGSENILMTSETNPPVAALHYPRDQAAYLAMEKLVQIMGGDDGEAAQSEELEALFIPRQSLDKA